jgi:hypothetical protein
MTNHLPLNRETLTESVASLADSAEEMAAPVDIVRNQEAVSLANVDLYVTQLDTDIAWYFVFGNSGDVMTIQPMATPFSTNLETAEAFGRKVVTLAQEKGALVSSLDDKLTSYPILGFLIFTIRFIDPPRVNVIGSIGRQELADLLKTTSSGPADQYDVTSYIPTWLSDQRRYVLHSNAFTKLRLVNIRLVRTNQIDDHIAFCLYNGLSGGKRLGLREIQLIKELMANGDGKSFLPFQSQVVRPVGQAGGQDPYYESYIKYKKKYIQKLARKAKK